ncbi:MAG: AAA family ATPase [Pseudomonadota bacterium]
MYEQFFGLTEKPFTIQPDPSFLYWGRTHRLAYAMLEYGVLNHAGISVITGEVGCGKTTLVHRLLDQLSDTHTVSLLSNVQEGRGDLLSWVLMSFGQAFAGKTHVELFAQLQSFFIGEYAKGKRVVLIIDEAQNLSADMLEELRLLSNINAGKDQLLQLILVGQPQLKDLLNRPELLQLAQRVGADFHLTPLSKKEVHAYIETRLSIAGCRRRIFTERAIDLIAEQSRGVPRVINIVADTALVYAFSAEDLVVGVETIRNVIRDKVQYGVFGLASDDVAAPANDGEANGPDAFVREDRPAEVAPPASDGGRARSSSEESDRSYSQTPDRVHEPEAFEDPAPASTVARTVADLKTNVQTQLEPKAQPVQVVEKTAPPEDTAITGVIVIGAGKKTSPEAAIRSVGDGRAIVFVSMGASQEANAIARRAGAIVVDENERTLTTGGRARNAAYRQLKKVAPHIKFVQFLNADSVLDPDWIATAERFMSRRPEVAVVDGQIKSASGAPLEYATVADRKRRETDGEIQTIWGGSALMRTDRFESVGGFRGDLLTTETTDLCIRLRRRGGHIWRLEETMMLCDPKVRARKSWWSRAMRRGYENAYGASLHGGPPERLGVMDVARAVVWGFLFPVATIVAAVLGGLGAAMLSPLTPWQVISGLILVLGVGVYVIKIFASILRHGAFKPSSWRRGYCAVMGRFAEFFGVMRFWFGAKRPSRVA